MMSSRLFNVWARGTARDSCAALHRGWKLDTSDVHCIRRRQTTRMNAFRCKSIIKRTRLNKVRNLICLLSKSHFLLPHSSICRIGRSPGVEDQVLASISSSDSWQTQKLIVIKRRQRDRYLTDRYLQPASFSNKIIQLMRKKGARVKEQLRQCR